MLIELIEFSGFKMLSVLSALCGLEPQSSPTIDKLNQQPAGQLMNLINKSTYKLNQPVNL